MHPTIFILLRYSDTFGVNTVLKTGQNATIFKYFMQCLTQLIPREPKEMLHIHIQSSVRTPVHCNSLVFDYKALSRIRLEELKHAVYVKFVSLKILKVYFIVILRFLVGQKNTINTFNRRLS